MRSAPVSPQFVALRGALLRAGVAPVYVQRTVLELADHYDDLAAAARDAGLDEVEAARWAERTLGREDIIVAAVLARPELKVWTERWPRASLALRSVAVVGLLPLVPFAFCVDRGAVIVRWGLSTALALLVTGALLLSLNWVILLY